MEFKIYKHRLFFKFKAGTSRGVLTHKDTWFIKIWHKDNPQLYGLGECSPLPGLSPEYSDNFQEIIEREVKRVLESLRENVVFEISELSAMLPSNLPSIRFGLETAILDLKNGGIRKIFDCDFFNRQTPISINGLVWMGNKDFMMRQVHQKIEQGFDCLKIKVGAINFEEEINILKNIRNKYSHDEITIRLDANGAFTEDNVFQALDEYVKYSIHSIEQPVKPGQHGLLRKICLQSPVPIALDEELLGVADKETLLDEINPQYVILKPSLLGGMAESKEWIKNAEDKNIGWWMTSLLESNVGLNSISQFASYLDTDMPQGLGTGQLYENNIPSPLAVRSGHIAYEMNRTWDLKIFN